MNETGEYNDSQRFLGVVRELYGRVAYSHKTHEKDRERWSKNVGLTRWANVVLVGATFLLATMGAVLDDQTIFIATSVVGAISTAFVVYQLSFNPEKSESEHRMAAKRLLYLRDRYLVLIQEAMSHRSTPKQLQSKLESLQRETSIVYDFSPDTSSKAYAAAGDALKTNEELTFSAEEIDTLLPVDLRSSGLNAGPDENVKH